MMMDECKELHPSPSKPHTSNSGEFLQHYMIDFDYVFVFAWSFIVLQYLLFYSVLERYHVGSLAFGSVLLTTFQLLRILLEYIEHKYRGKATDTMFFKWIHSE